MTIEMVKKSLSPSKNKLGNCPFESGVIFKQISTLIPLKTLNNTYNLIFSSYCSCIFDIINLEKAKILS